MLKTIRNAWSIPDLRKKLLFTLMIIIVFRIGSVIPVPFLDMSALATAMNGMNEGNTMLAYLNTLSGGAFANATLLQWALHLTSTAQLLCSSLLLQFLLLREWQKRERQAEENRYYYPLCNSWSWSCSGRCLLVLSPQIRCYSLHRGFLTCFLCYCYYSCFHSRHSTYDVAW